MNKLPLTVRAPAVKNNPCNLFIISILIFYKLYRSNVSEKNVSTKFGLYYKLVYV